MNPKYLITLVVLLFAAAAVGQKKPAPTKTSVTYDEKLYNALEWRNIGPFRGGRSAAVTGVPGKPNLFYMGATGGVCGARRMQEIPGKTFQTDSSAALSAP